MMKKKNNRAPFYEEKGKEKLMFVPKGPLLSYNSSNSIPCSNHLAILFGCQTSAIMA